MIVYQVTATVETPLSKDFERFMLDVHIPDILLTGSFVRASLERSADGRYRMSYFAESREDLDRYFSDNAPRLREDVQRHFPEGLTLSREEWTLLKTFA